MKLTQTLLLLTVLFLPSLVRSQVDQIVENEDELVNLYNAILLSEKDGPRDSNNTAFYQLIEETLKLEGSFEYPFDRLPTISKMAADDKSKDSQNRITEILSKG